MYDNGTQPILQGNGTRPEIPLSCPTGNCTWPQYQSLGACSKCADVSNLLTFKCIYTTVDWIANLTWGTDATFPNGTMCGYFLNTTSESDKPVMMSGYLVESVKSDPSGTGAAGEALLTRLLPLTTNPCRQPLYGGPIHFKNFRNPIADILIVSAPNGVESVYRNETPIAHECVLSFCVKTFISGYYKASYEEEVVNTFENNTAGPFP